MGQPKIRGPSSSSSSCSCPQIILYALQNQATNTYLDVDASGTLILSSSPVYRWLYAVGDSGFYYTTNPQTGKRMYMVAGSLQSPAKTITMDAGQIPSQQLASQIAGQYFNGSGIRGAVSGLILDASTSGVIWSPPMIIDKQTGRLNASEVWSPVPAQ